VTWKLICPRCDGYAQHFGWCPTVTGDDTIEQRVAHYRRQADHATFENALVELVNAATLAAEVANAGALTGLCPELEALNIAISHLKSAALAEEVLS